MLYFKHAELAKRYRISLRTVHNWIEATKQGKLDLDLHFEGNKTYVAQSSRNLAIITKLVEGRRKYRNTRAAKLTTPKQAFYELFSEEQIHDIVTNLEVHHEIPRQYNYFDGGAEHWASYAKRLASEHIPNYLNTTIKLLDINKFYIDTLLTSYSKVNVIDIGVGDAYPAKNFLEHLQAQGKLGRYIALDISPSMLKIAEANIKSWFDDTLTFEGYACDINFDRFSRFVVNEYLKSEKTDNKTANVVLLLGGTLSNMRYPDNGFRIIHDSMGIHDLLIHTIKLDTETSRKYFDFNSAPSGSALSPNHRLIFDLLGIDDSFYDVEMGYDPTIRQRYIRARLKVAVTIEFSHPNGKRTVLLNKDDTILLLRVVQDDMTEVLQKFTRNDFHPLHFSQTEDAEYALTIARVNRD